MLQWVNMTDIKPLNKALFLTEAELRRGIELIFFAYRDFTGKLTRYWRNLALAEPITEPSILLVVTLI